MAATITVSITDNANGELTTEILTMAFSIPNPVDERQVLDLVEGDNTIDIAAGTSLVCVIPPTNNLQALKQKSTGADAGEPRGTVTPWFFPVSGQTSFVLNAAGAVTDLVVHSL